MRLHGRLMQSRRWSDGLHQAVEAKEGVKIEREKIGLFEEDAQPLGQ